jgi:hypothetical protein
VNNNRTYIILTFILIIFSVFGLYYFYLQENQAPVPTDIAVEPATPTENVEVPQISPMPTFTPSDTSIFPDEMTPVTSTPTILAVIPTPTPEFQNLNNSQFNFSVNYSSSRRLYEDPEYGGVRFTFYSPAGNIALHVGPNWSWQHPGRQFNSDTIVSGQQTFVYKTSNQTIIDFQSDNTKYTIQCVHGAKDSLITECEQFTSSFSILSGS